MTSPNRSAGGVFNRIGARNGRPQRNVACTDNARLAKGLGWFSIGLGVAQLVSPGGVAGLIGVRPEGRARSVIRAVGARELAAGAGILSSRRPAGWLWSRVGGDAMDLAMLARAMTSDRARRERVAMAMMAVAGVTGLDVLSGVRRLKDAGTDNEGSAVRVKKTITVNRPPEELYRFWHDLQNLPRFMAHLEDVSVRGDRRSHWKAKGPAGSTVEWDAEIVEDRPNELIAWRSLPGAGVDNSGSVRFTRAPGGRGTEVVVELGYDPPGGKVGATIARLLGEEPSVQVMDELRRFKQIVETGEIIRSDGSPEGLSARQQLKQRSAQPPERAPEPNGNVAGTREPAATVR